MLVKMIPKVIQSGGLFRSLKFDLFLMYEIKAIRENIARAKYPMPIITAKVILAVSAMIIGKPKCQKKKNRFPVEKIRTKCLPGLC